MTRPYQVRYSRPATRDLEQLHDWMTANRSLQQADALLNAMTTAIDSLETFPFRGSVPPELAELGEDQVRQFSLPPYRLFYRVAGQTVMVLLIADARRELRALLRERLLSR